MPSQPKPKGRPTKLTPEVQDRLLAAIRAGNYLDTSAAHAGIHRDTLHAWMRDGANAKSPELQEFSDAVQKAIGDAESMHVARIAAASSKQWQAAAWWLERRYPDRWGQKLRQEVTGEGGGPIKVTFGGRYREAGKA